LPLCKKLFEGARPRHADHQMADVFPLIHRHVQRTLNAFKLGIEQVPNAGFDRVGVAQNINLNRPGLAIARQSPNSLMQAHRVPRHVDMDQRGAALLQVDPFAGRFG